MGTASGLGMNKPGQGGAELRALTLTQTWARGWAPILAQVWNTEWRWEPQQACGHLCTTLPEDSLLTTAINPAPVEPKFS